VTRDEFSKNTAILGTSQKITRKDYQSGFTIDVTGPGKSGQKQPVFSYGSVRVPSGLIPVGWTVDIYSVNETDLEKPKPTKKRCSDGNVEGSDEAEIVSVAFNLVIRDEKGRERSLEALLKKRGKEGLGLELSYSLSKEQRSSDNSLQFGYLRDGDPSWKFLEDTQDISAKHEFGRAKGTTNHLTSECSFSSDIESSLKSN